MSSKKEIVDTIRQVAIKAANEFGCRVMTVGFKKELGDTVLQVIVDGDEPISVDKCADISRKMSEWLDAHEKDIPYADYLLEVSSPGGMRQLSTKEDFERYLNLLVQIETKSKAADGRKRYKGRIQSVNEISVTIYVAEESAVFDLALGDISKARIEYEF